LTNPHDALFRFTFSQVDHAEGLLRFLLPKRFIAEIDWTELHAYPTATADQSLRLHHADLLFQARVRGGHEPVLFLLEHKSAPDEALMRQLHRYVVHIVTEWQRTKTTVPHVVPVVVHHGRRKFAVAWSASRKTDSDRLFMEYLTTFQPRLQFLLDDLTICTEAMIRARPLSAMAQLTLLFLRFLPQMTDEAALRALGRWRALLTAVDATRERQLCRGALSSYLLDVTNLPADRLNETVARIVSKPNEDFAMSTADKLRAEGRAEGRAQERIEVVLRLLTARFGPLPTDLAARVSSASMDALDRWALRILDASSLAEVFVDD
jgi:predicted transposase/invertase (TIGR01784 family)